MPVTTSTALLAVGTGLQVASKFEERKGQRKAERASQEAEATRREQLRLEKIQARRKQVREAQKARGAAVTAQVASGGGEFSSSSSIFAGIDAATTGVGNQNIAQINQSENLGNKLFDLNAEIAQGQAEARSASGFGQLGNTILRNNDKLTQLFQSTPSDVKS